MKTRTYRCGPLTVEIMVDREQRGRIASRSFRGRGVQKAGNFRDWNDIGQFFSDPDFEEFVLPALVTKALTDPGMFTVQAEMGYAIGWTTVEDVTSMEDPPECHTDTLDNGVKAQFVVDLPAPLKSCLTLIGTSRMRGSDTLQVLLFNVRPGIATPPFKRPYRRKGRQIGGSVPEELNLVFWKFDDPGEQSWDDEDEDRDVSDRDQDLHDWFWGTGGQEYDGPLPEDFDRGGL